MERWKKCVLFVAICTATVAGICGLLVGPMLFGLQKQETLTLIEMMAYATGFGGIIGACISLWLLIASGFGKYPIAY